jgi:hypothetical protein
MCVMFWVLFWVFVLRLAVFGQCLMPRTIPAQLARYERDTAQKGDTTNTNDKKNIALCF